MRGYYIVMRDVIDKLVFAVHPGESIASEGSGEYLFVEGHVRSTSGKPIAGALIETWETDSHGKLVTVFLAACSGPGLLLSRLLRYSESCSRYP